MLMESKIQGFFEMELFDKLCKKCTQMENGSFTYSGESLRFVTFGTLSLEHFFLETLLSVACLAVEGYLNIT